MRRRFVLVGLFFFVTTVGVCSNIYLDLTSPMFFIADDYGFGVRQQVGRLVVGPINPNGPAATLQTGDEFVSLDGEKIRYQTDLITAFRRHQPDSSYLTASSGRALKRRIRCGIKEVGSEFCFDNLIR